MNGKSSDLQRFYVDSKSDILNKYANTQEIVKKSVERRIYVDSLKDNVTRKCCTGKWLKQPYKFSAEFSASSAIIHHMCPNCHIYPRKLFILFSYFIRRRNLFIAETKIYSTKHSTFPTTYSNIPNMRGGGNIVHEISYIKY